MNLLNIITRILFMVPGTAILIGAYLSYQSTESFLLQATKTEGTVIELVQSSPKSAFYPIVQFISQNGQTIKFKSSNGKKPPKYSKGQKIEVLYQITEPQNAKINDFASLWSLTTIASIIGGVFFLSAAIIVYIDIRNTRKKQNQKK